MTEQTHKKKVEELAGSIVIPEYETRLRAASSRADDDEIEETQKEYQRARAKRAERQLKQEKDAT